MNEIIGIIRQSEFAKGSESEGIRSYLEVLETGELYQLYRKDVYSIGDSYFDQFKDHHVVVFGEMQNRQCIMVENVELINTEE